ncbi:MAG: DsbA family protein [Actinobacteria bacterium]|nr:DsbA family protein [Actinomycetota bacterium]
MASAVTKLVYVGDPMCSWCWGFAPEIEALAEDHPVEVVVGGLRPGPMAQELDDRLAGSLRHHWVEVAERTGQPFDPSFLDRRDGWVYDTEPAAIAVTTFRLLHPDLSLDYFTVVQRAFYAAGRDVTEFPVLADLASDFEVDPTTFGASLDTEEAKQRAWDDFARARNWGISGFPTLVGELGDGRLALLARGWAEAESVRARIASLDEALAG